MGIQLDHLHLCGLVPISNLCQSRRPLLIRHPELFRAGERGIMNLGGCVQR